MPLQNRVDPFGAIHADASRGLFTGNRGVIHDPSTRTLLRRRWTTTAWIICDCGFRGWKRDVMGRNAPSGGAGWTNLFFLDEATALAAGHRPCFFCRRAKATAFADCLGRGSRVGRPTAPEIDRRLHRERLASGGVPRVATAAELDDLPDGAMTAFGTRCFARRSGRWLEWSFAGYASVPGGFPGTEARLLTPPTTVAALAAGYRPVWHPSAIR
jgi:hypothetical protein